MYQQYLATTIAALMTPLYTRNPHNPHDSHGPTRSGVPVSVLSYPSPASLRGNCEGEQCVARAIDRQRWEGRFSKQGRPMYALTMRLGKRWTVGGKGGGFVVSVYKIRERRADGVLI